MPVIPSSFNIPSVTIPVGVTNLGPAQLSANAHGFFISLTPASDAEFAAGKSMRFDIQDSRDGGANWRSRADWQTDLSVPVPLDYDIYDNPAPPAGTQYRAHVTMTGGSFHTAVSGGTQ